IGFLGKYRRTRRGSKESTLKGRHMKRMVLAAAVGVGVSIGFAGPAHAADHWVAIAWSASKDVSNTSYGPESQADAERQALQQCSQQASDCQIMASSADCIALT